MPVADLVIVVKPPFIILSMPQDPLTQSALVVDIEDVTLSLIPALANPALPASARPKPKADSEEMSGILFPENNVCESVFLRDSAEPPE